MKIRKISLVLLGAAGMLLGSCAGTYWYSSPGQGSVAVSTGGWQSAWYDSNGFPIFGYVGSRPVYGYTSAGVAIFDINLIGVNHNCYVPYWGPASWYHGHYHYPAHVHRCHVPPRCPESHRPSYRPPRPTSREANNRMVHHTNKPSVVKKPTVINNKPSVVKKPTVINRNTTIINRNVDKRQHAEYKKESHRYTGYDKGNHSGVSGPKLGVHKPNTGQPTQHAGSSATHHPQGAVRPAGSRPARPHTSVRPSHGSGAGRPHR